MPPFVDSLFAAHLRFSGCCLFGSFRYILFTRCTFLFLVRLVCYNGLTRQPRSRPYTFSATATSRRSTTCRPANKEKVQTTAQLCRQVSFFLSFLQDNPDWRTSVTECRRLKLKCDRDIPCSNCVRRGCRELCPDGVKETRRALVTIILLFAYYHFRFSNTLHQWTWRKNSRSTSETVIHPRRFPHRTRLRSRRWQWCSSPPTVFIF